MRKLGYTLLFLFCFSAAGIFVSGFSFTWQSASDYLYGAPFASQNLSAPDRWLEVGILLDLLVWIPVSILATVILFRFWRWPQRMQLASLVGFSILVLSLHNTEIFTDYLRSGWPMKAIVYGEISPLALVVNTLAASLVGFLAYFLAHLFRGTRASFPGLGKMIFLCTGAFILFLVLALALPTQGAVFWETPIQDSFVLADGFIRDVLLFITEISSPTATLFLSFVVLLALRDKDLKLAFLPLLASALLVFGIAEAKEIIERERPPTSIGEISGYALPAGHAASSIIYLFLAFLLRGKKRWIPIFLGAVGVVFLCGWMRILLGFHWFGDLLAGWSWGIAVYAFAALLIGGGSLLFTRFSNRLASRREQ